MTMKKSSFACSCSDTGVIGIIVDVGERAVSSVINADAWQNDVKPPGWVLVDYRNLRGKLIV